MTKYLKSKIKKILIFIEKNLMLHHSMSRKKVKSPIDLYLEAISKECYDFFKEHFKVANIFTSTEDIRNFALNHALKYFNKENLFLEFGVFKGHSINNFAQILKKKKFEIYGFDSFSGLEEDWISDDYNPAGTFALKKIPKLNSNVRLVVGPVQNSLLDFLRKQNEKKIAFIHFDMDNYAPTKFVLTNVKPRLEKGAIIIFDEFYGYPNWKNHEFKAFQEVFNENEYSYIGFSQRQAVVKIN